MLISLKIVNTIKSYDAAVTIPTSRLEAETGESAVLDFGSFVSESLNDFADSS